MSLIAESHLQFIIEVAVVIQVGMIFLLNLIPMSLSFVLLGALILASALTGIFTMDTLLLFIPGFTHHELTHPFGSVALLAIITSFAALPMMKEVGIKFRNLKIYLILLISYYNCCWGFDAQIFPAIVVFRTINRIFYHIKIIQTEICVHHQKNTHGSCCSCCRIWIP